MDAMLRWTPGAGAGSSLDDLGLDLPRRERRVVGFVVSTAVANDLRTRFPEERRRPTKRENWVQFRATPIVVDPAAPAGQCLAVYDPDEWARLLAAIEGGARP